MAEETNTDLVELATELTIAWLGNPNNRATAEDVPAFLRTMHSTVAELTGGSDGASDSQTAEDQGAQHVPAVTARKSLASKDHIVSMIDGKRYKTLKRHLGTNGLTPAEYRARYNLKPDYPMVAPNYSEARRAMAHKIGLGRKGRAAKTAAAAASASVRKPRPAKKSA